MPTVAVPPSNEAELDELRREVARLRDHMVRQERLTSVGLLLSDIAHEIYNPLAWVTLNTGLLRMGLEQAHSSGGASDLVARLPKLLDLLHDNEEGLLRIQHVVDALRLMSRSHGEAKTDEDVNAICQKTIIMLNGAFKKKGVEVHGEYADLPPVRCNGNDVAQAVMNLLVNAHEAVGLHGRLWLRTSMHDNELSIDVLDDGPGVPLESRDRVFEAFYTTKPLGTGLGLPLVQSVATAHGGRVELRDRPGGGAWFRFLISNRVQ